MHSVPSWLRHRSFLGLGSGFALVVGACVVEPTDLPGDRRDAVADADTADPFQAARRKGNLASCTAAPIGVATSDYWLHFVVPDGLMPDDRFDGRPAKLSVHRVRPVYADEGCAAKHVAVLIHGRTVPGPPVFDLQHDLEAGGSLSVQEALASAGIDTFVPSLLGYGRSTRFDDGLNDPCNASLPGVDTAGNCPTESVGCDRTHNPVFPLNQQRTLLSTHPLADEVCSHSSSERFGRTDVFVRDLGQVVGDAVERAGLPPGGKVTLVAYSFGAQTVGRALNPDNPVLPEEVQGIIAKVDKVVFMAPLFLAPGGTLPAEEVEPPGGFATFPLHLTTEAGVRATWSMPAGRNEVCTGHIVPGSREQAWQQVLDGERVGREWGGSDPDEPSGLNRSPTFSTYGFNASVAQKLTIPSVLVIQGLDDLGLPPPAPGVPPHKHACALYDALPTTLSNKALVEIDCASHALAVEGCSEGRCTPAVGAPYGGGASWRGPHATVTAALTEWILYGTFDGQASGRFLVDASGVAHPGLPVTCPDP